jgi:hypothetical protein
MDGLQNRLRYLNASLVETPVGYLSDTVVVAGSDRMLGKLDGIVIDPIEHQVRYFVIKARHWLRVHRYLLPAAPLQVEADRKALHLVGKSANVGRLPKINPETFSACTAADLIGIPIRTAA